MIETNIDDVSSEILGYVMDRLMSIALDVFYTPIYMKKNRPAYKLSILCETNCEEEALDIVFRHTTAIGIRKYNVDRVVLDRRIENIDTKYGNAVVKVAVYGNEKYCYPEYESVKKIADDFDLPLKTVYSELINEYEKASKCDL